MAVLITQRSIGQDAVQALRLRGVEAVRVAGDWRTFPPVDGLSVDRIHVENHLSDAILWRDALGAATRLCDTWMPARGPTWHCAVQSWAAEVLVPLVVGFREGREAASGLDPTLQRLALPETGVSGVGFLYGSRASAINGIPSDANPTAPSRLRRLGVPDRRPTGVLLVELFAYRLNVLTPLVERLHERGERVRLLSLAKTIRERDLHRAWADSNGVSVEGWENWLGAAMPRSAGHIVAGGVRGRTILRQLEQELGHLEPGLAAVGRDPRLLKALTFASLRAAFLYELFSRVIAQARPRFVLTCRGDGPTLRALSFAGQECKIPVIDVQHGRQDLLPPGSVLDIPHTRFALSSLPSIRAYAAQGVSRDQLHQVGSVAFDRLIHEARVQPVPRSGAYLVYSCSADGTTAVDQWNATSRVASGGRSIAESHTEMLNALVEVSRKHPMLEVVVVPHPRQHGDAVPVSVRRRFPEGRLSVVNPAANGPLFAGAVAHVSLGSTTALEAALVGTPALIVEPSGQSSYFDDAVVSGAIVRVDDPRALPDVIASIVGRRVDTGPLIRSYATSDDGRTADRILDLASTLASDDRS